MINAENDCTATELMCSPAGRTSRRDGAHMSVQRIRGNERETDNRNAYPRAHLENPGMAHGMRSGWRFVGSGRGSGE